MGLTQHVFNEQISWCFYDDGNVDSFVVDESWNKQLNSCLLSPILSIDMSMIIIYIFKSFGYAQERTIQMLRGTIAQLLPFLSIFILSDKLSPQGIGNKMHYYYYSFKIVETWRTCTYMPIHIHTGTLYLMSAMMDVRGTHEFTWIVPDNMKINLVIPLCRRLWERMVGALKRGTWSKPFSGLISLLSWYQLRQMAVSALAIL